LARDGDGEVDLAALLGVAQLELLHGTDGAPVVEHGGLFEVVLALVVGHSLVGQRDAHLLLLLLSLRPKTSRSLLHLHLACLLLDQTLDPVMPVHFPNADPAERVAVEAATNEVFEVLRDGLTIGEG
jgi:hypothetical protein